MPDRRSRFLQHVAVHHPGHQEADRIGDAVRAAGASAAPAAAGSKCGAHVALRLEQLGMAFGEGRDVAVPFEQGGGAAGAGPGEAEQFPDFGPHRPVVGVDDVGAAILVAGEVHLDDALAREGVDIGDRVGAGVEAADIDVVDVEQQAAAGLLGEPAQEFGLLHRRMRRSARSCSDSRGSAAARESPAPAAPAPRRGPGSPRSAASAADRAS